MKKLTSNPSLRSAPLLFAAWALLAWPSPALQAGTAGRADLLESAGDLGEARIFTSLSERRALDAIDVPPQPAAAVLAGAGERPLQIQPEAKPIGENPSEPLSLPMEAEAPAERAPLPAPVIENKGFHAEVRFEAMHFDAIISRPGWARLWVNGERAEEGEALPNGLEWTLFGGLTARFRDQSGRSFDLFPGQELATSAGGNQ